MDYGEIISRDSIIRDTVQPANLWLKSKSSFPGKLFPEGLKYLKNAEDKDEVRRICERFGAYKDLYQGVGDGPNDKTLEDKFFEEEVGGEITIAWQKLYSHFKNLLLGF